MQKLWLLSRYKFDYDQYTQFTIIAPTEEDARQMAYEQTIKISFGKVTYQHEWLSEEFSSCERITLNKSMIVSCQFNSG